MLIKNLSDGYFSKPDLPFWSKLLNALRRPKSQSHQQSADELFDGHDFKHCANSKHMFDAVNMQYSDIVSELERILSQQHPKTQVINFKALSTPQWLSVAGKENEKGNSLLLRCGFALESKAILKSISTSQIESNFIFSFVCVDIGLPTRRQQFWIDFDGSIQDFGSDGELLSRLYRPPTAN